MSKTMQRSALLLILLLVVAGAAGASAVDGKGAGNRLTGCRNTSTGTLDQLRGAALPIGGACGSGEVMVSWNKTGPQGEPGVSGYEQVSATFVVTDTMVSRSVDCPAGKKVVGGGHFVVSAAAYASTSYPFDDDTWYVQAYKTAGAGTWGLTVYAICVTALP